MRVTVRGHNPLLEIDLGCVMCLRCAMQTGRGVARRALAEWGWLRADACGLFELYPRLGALPLCGFENFGQQLLPVVVMAGGRFFEGVSAVGALSPFGCRVQQCMT